MISGLRSFSMLLVTGVLALSIARAATVEEGAAAAARAWAQAIMTRNVDEQMKLLPSTMFSDSAARERFRWQRLREIELAAVNKQKYLSFDVRAPVQTLKTNKATVVVLPYRSVVSTAEGRLQTDSTLVALAREGSEQWSVFDGSGRDSRTLKTLIPDYATGLDLPPTMVKLIKNE